MDNKQFISRLSKKASLDYRETASTVKSAVATLLDILSEGDSAAIPSFGTFSTRKTDETVVISTSTGRRILMPPSISIEFAESAILAKRLTNITRQDG